MQPIIETPRLLLREITISDTSAMLRLHSNPKVQQYTGDPIIKSKAAMETAIKERINNYKKYGYGRWATILKEDNSFIGWAGLDYLFEIDEIDLGYRFLPEYWGQGFATEACTGILGYGFNQLKIKKIIALAFKENLASIRVMEKIGMVFYQQAPFDRCGPDVVWYKKTINEFSE